ncbi:MAG: 2-amino-4-hydroxy-6-hydroxymethyldihydropteridine diphosphokinase [Steroidobacteraceae bacterium]
MSGAAASASVLWRPAYVGLGSNIGDAAQQVRRAAHALSEFPSTRLIALSPLYRSVPYGPVEQPDFINAVAALLTRQSLDAFFADMRAVERALGRTPARERWGPREIDLDLLAFGTEMRRGGELVLPHAGIPERDFVLYPLCDVAPELQLPGMGVVRQLAARVPDRGMRRLT